MSKHDVSVNRYGIKCWTPLRFCKNKGCINEIDPHGWFSGILDTGWVEDQDDKRQINRCKKLEVALEVN